MILEFLPYNASGPIWQVVHSAAANAKHNYGLDKKKLIIDEAFANEGPKVKTYSTKSSRTSLQNFKTNLSYYSGYERS
jgi:large subunit ribosomal protein L22